MRITGGFYGGRKLAEFEGIGVRPTSDMLKEGLFNSIGDEIVGKSFLDMFAGTGAVGIDAFSRGAARAVLCDNSRESVKLIQKNLAALKINDGVETVFCDAIKYVSQSTEKFDYIFIDPPYAAGAGLAAVNAASGILNDGGTIIYEDEKDYEPKVDGLALVKKKRYGRAHLYFFKRKRAACVFAGTFDPVTNGHIRIIKECLNRFEKVIVTIGENADKTPLFDIAEREKFLRAALKSESRVKIVRYSDYYGEYYGFLIKEGVYYYVRGIRNSADAAYESVYEKQNLKLYPLIKTEYVKAEKEYKNVSASEVRKRLTEGKSVKGLVPDETLELIAAAMRDKK